MTRPPFLARRRSAISSLSITIAIAVAGPVHASQPPDLLLEAMDINEAWVIPGTLTTAHPVDGASSPSMFDLRVSLGVIPPTRGPVMALLSTGEVENIQGGMDHDYPPNGEGGDRATLSFSLAVPESAGSFAFDFYFLTREYPEWIGDIYVDEFTVEMANPTITGQIVWDADGNEVSMNSSLLAITAPTALAGTGFDQDGGTGWVRTTAPCEGGSILRLVFSIRDQDDGFWDSAVLLDNFQFMDGPPSGDASDSVPIPFEDLPPPWDAPPLQLTVVAPSEGPIAGGYPVDIVGSGLDEAVVVRVGDTLLLDPSAWVTVDGGERLEVLQWPPGESLGVVGVEVWSAARDALLPSAFTYIEPPVVDEGVGDDDGGRGDDSPANPAAACAGGEDCGIGPSGGRGLLMLMLLVFVLRRRPALPAPT